MMCTKLVLINTGGGEKSPARRSFEDSGLVRFPCTAHNEEAAKERTAPAIVKDRIMTIVRDGVGGIDSTPHEGILFEDWRCG